MNMEQPAASSNLRMPDLQNIYDTAKDSLTKSVGNLGQTFSDVQGTLTKTLDDFSATSGLMPERSF